MKFIYVEGRPKFCNKGVDQKSAYNNGMHCNYQMWEQMKGSRSYADTRSLFNNDEMAKENITNMLNSAFKDYINNRVNGKSTDYPKQECSSYAKSCPNLGFPKDGKFTFKELFRDKIVYFTVEYEAGEEDKKFAESIDRNYLARLQKENTLVTLEPQVWGLLEEDKKNGIDTTDIKAWWRNKQQQPNLAEELENVLIPIINQEIEVRPYVSRRELEYVQTSAANSSIPPLSSLLSWVKGMFSLAKDTKPNYQYTAKVENTREEPVLPETLYKGDATGNFALAMIALHLLKRAFGWNPSDDFDAKTTMPVLSKNIKHAINQMTLSLVNYQQKLDEYKSKNGIDSSEIANLSELLENANKLLVSLQQEPQGGDSEAVVEQLGKLSKTLEAVETGLVVLNLEQEIVKTETTLGRYQSKFKYLANSSLPIAQQQIISGLQWATTRHLERLQEISSKYKSTYDVRAVAEKIVDLRKDITCLETEAQELETQIKEVLSTIPMQGQNVSNNRYCFYHSDLLRTEPVVDCLPTSASAPIFIGIRVESQ